MGIDELRIRFDCLAEEPLGCMLVAFVSSLAAFVRPLAWAEPCGVSCCSETVVPAARLALD